MFLPFGDEHLALVLTVPEGAPAGVVLLLTGGSAARSHRFQLWTRVARSLAKEHALASARLDYLGTGDSTGSLPEWHISDVPVDQARAVAAFAMEALGVDRLAAAGNCIGSRVALELAADMPECKAALCIRNAILEPTRLGMALRRTSEWKLAARLRSNPVLHRLLGRHVARRKRKTGGAVRSLLSKALPQKRLLFMYCEEDLAFPQMKTLLDRLMNSLSDEERAGLELCLLDGSGLKGFESLDIQQRVIDKVVEWLGATLPTPSAALRQVG